jgi:hypothetical protein
MTRSIPYRLLCLIATVSAFATPSAAQNSNASAAPGTADRAPDAKPAGASAPAKLIYRPPVRGAPGGRVGGGSRGSERELFLLLALAPEHSALTALEQPTLYWYISRPTELPIEFTLIDAKGTQPLVETRIVSPTSAGVQRLSLSNYGVKLTPGVAYRWYVAVIADPQRRSKDILAGGAVERVEVPEQAAAALRAAPREARPARLAEAGLWYDALQALGEWLEAEPSSAEALRQRAELLTQVGLTGLDTQ